MFFLVTRTSYSMEEKPCYEAFEQEVQMEVKNKAYNYPKWVVEMSGDDLIQFSAKYGRIILSTKCGFTINGEAIPCIEIYDSYRE